MKTKVYRAPSMEIVNMGNMEFVTMLSSKTCIAPDSNLYNMTQHDPWEGGNCPIPGGDMPVSPEDGPSI